MRLLPHILAVLLIATRAGCASKPPYNPTNAMLATGSAVAKTYAHAESATWDFAQIKDYVAKEALGFYQAGMNELATLRPALDTVTVALDRVAVEKASADAEVSLLRGDIKAIKNGWPYWIGVKVCWAFGILVTFIGVWLIGLAIEQWFGAMTPVGRIAGLAARVAAFWAWPQWYAEHRNVKEALNTYPPPKQGLRSAA